MRKSRLEAALLAALLLVLALAVSAVAAPPAQGDATAAGMSLDTIPGIYVSSVYPAADASGLVQVLELYENQNAQMLSFYVGKDAPIMAQGTWASEDGVNVIVTLTSYDGQPLEKPDETTYTFDAGTLADGPFVLTKLWEISPDELAAGTMPKLPAEAPTSDDPSGVYVSAVYPAADASGMLELLALYPNNNAQLISIYVGKDAPVVENGTWQLTDASAVELTLTGTPERQYEKPSVTTYQRGGDALDDGLFVLFRLNEVTPEEMDALVGAPPADDDATLGSQLVDGFYAALKRGDKEQLAAMLAPSFQLLRSSGEVFDAASYPDAAPVYEAYAVDNLKVTRAGDALVATYTAQTDATVDGTEALGEAAPRLTVFQQIDGAWKMVAHANFGPPPAAEPAAATEAAPAAAGVTVTESDDGSSVQVGAGGQLVVELAGNPTTGYAWQVVANDESILLPTAYEFTPDSDAAGAGGVEKFTFHVMAPGAVNLELVNSRPWETDTPPAKTFTLAVEAVAEPAPDNAMITVGVADNGGAVTLLPGAVLLVSLDGAADGMWMLTQGDAMIVQPLGDWQAAPSAADATQATFQRSFLGVGPGAVNIQFEFMHADGSMGEDVFAITVDVLPQEPGSSGAVVVGEGDAGGAFDLVTGDTLVVRVPGNPTTGYDWRVVSTNDALLPSAGDPTYAVDSDLTGAGGVYTFRFPARSPGEAAVQISEFAPGADQPETTLDFNVTIADPAPLTGNTVVATAADSGKEIAVAAGDWLDVTLESNPSTGYLWVVTANDGAVLRLLPESGYTVSGDMPGSGGVQRFAFRALQPGAVDLTIGHFPPGVDTPEQVVEFAVTVK